MYVDLTVPFPALAAAGDTRADTPVTVIATVADVAMGTFGSGTPPNPPSQLQAPTTTPTTQRPSPDADVAATDRHSWWSAEVSSATVADRLDEIHQPIG